MKFSAIRLPLAHRVFLLLACVGLLTSVPGSVVLYRGASSALREEVRDRLRHIARTAALQIPTEMHGRLLTRKDENSTSYRTIKTTLANIREANPDLRYVYTMRKTDKPLTLQFVVDAEESADLMSHVGDEYDVKDLPEMRRAFTGPAVDFEPSEDKWGIWLSGYAPIRDKNGGTQAIIGLDMSLEQLHEEEADLRRAAWTNAALAVIITILLSLLVTKAVVGRLGVFMRAAEKVRGGDLQFQLPNEGPPEMRAFCESFNQMIVGLKDSRDRMIEQSDRDFLTGLFNHRYFHERLASEIERAERYGGSLSLMILDVDRFKHINDHYGHPAGDRILKQVAETLQQEVRTMDVAARYGGDDFAIIAPEADKEAMVAIADRIREKITSLSLSALTDDPETLEQKSPRDNDLGNLTVTIGIASYPEHHQAPEGLVMAADMALYRAKYIGRNSICTYDTAVGDAPDMDPERLYRILRDPDAAAVQSLVAAVDARDRYTRGHSERVTEYALRLGEMLQVDEDMRDALKMAGLLHDLGKIGVPDAILNKPGRLTDEEHETIKRHPSVGGNILQRAPQLDRIIPGVLFHHERWDGLGYPDGLSGEGIPLIARILALADSFDAMTSDRPYRKALSVEQALAEIEANAGKQFDPDLAESFLIAMAPAAARKAA
ncbi:MAG: diguanylate cyclase [Armatimonadota bacterium]|nr:diguanylate cyclase [Armatimonadota bacterium]